MSKELIIRLREAASQRVASTAMISADDLIAAADALESLEADRDSWERQAGDRLDDVLRLVAERGALAAELKAAREQEPVVVIGSVYQLLWAESGPLAPIIEKHGLKVGSKLYAHPVPTGKLTDIVNDLSQQIRKINGNNSMGAGDLAEGIAEWADNRLKGDGE